MPKYTVPSDNEVITDPVEAWLYFFRQAEQMTTEDIERRFNSPAFSEAAQVLDMIQRTPQERSQYELRLKAQRDDRAKLQQARTEGKEEGKAEGMAEGKKEGEATGIIKALRGVLGIDDTSLDGLSLEQLTAMASDLQRQAVSYTHLTLPTIYSV